MAAKELTVERDMIDNMLRDQRFLNAFPFLKQAKAKAQRRGCGCGRTRRQKASKPNYNQIKRQLANLPPEKKAKLKQLLSANQLRIKFQRPEDGVKVVRVVT